MDMEKWTEIMEKWLADKDKSRSSCPAPVERVPDTFSDDNKYCILCRKFMKIDYGCPCYQHSNYSKGHKLDYAEKVLAPKFLKERRTKSCGQN